MFSKFLFFHLPEMLVRTTKALAEMDQCSTENIDDQLSNIFIPVSTENLHSILRKNSQ